MNTLTDNSNRVLRCRVLVRMCAMLAFALVSLGQAQEQNDSVIVARAIADLKLSAIPIRSGDPADLDFADLIPFEKTLDGVDLLLLGEQSHGEGSVFSAKIRLIKFLHEQMGFDVLAFESSFYGCAKDQEMIAATGGSKTIIPESIYSLWRKTTELQPLFEYIAATGKTDRPLILSGFDSRMVTSVDCGYLTQDLEIYLRQINSSAVEKPLWAFTRATLDSLLCRERQYQLTPTMVDSLAQGIRDVKLELQSRSLSELKSRFWQKVLDNMSVTSKVLRVPLSDWKRGNSLRDEQLADNLLWLMKEQYPGKRIVAWTASLHAARRLQEIEQSGVKPYDSLLTMGDVLHAALGRRMYSIAFSAYSGSYSDWAGQPKTIDTAFAGSLEGMMNHAGFERALFNFRALREDSDLATRRFLARPTGHAWRPAVWPHHFDGFIFERRVLSSTRLDK